MDNDFLTSLLKDPEMLRMGHGQSLEDRNIGLGWLYYALARIFRPQTAVVIGSWRGFSPMLIGKGLAENTDTGSLHFIDPSLADDFWQDPGRVRDYFDSAGLSNITHHRYTTQDFVNTDEFQGLDNIGLLMVDGFHSAEQARFDYLAFLDRLSDDAVVLFHDSISRRKSTFYGEEKSYEHTVCLFMDRLKMVPGLEVFNFPVASGVTLVRGKPESLELINRDFN